MVRFDADPYRLDRLVYDERNLPVQMEEDGRTYRYRYSASGQRTYKEQGGQVEHYLLDGSETLAVVKDGSVDAWNVTKAAGAPIGRHFANGGRRYYRTDLLGSTRAVVDGNGTVVETRDTYPFGLKMPGRDQTISDPTKEDYTGHELDDETGLHYAGARYYMSALGRWNGPDPLADTYPHASPYNYVENNPLLRYDPNGKSWWSKLAKATVKVGRTVARDGVGSLKKGATYAEAFSGVVSDAKTVLNPAASTGERVLAGLSLASEALPVSVSDVKDGYRAVRRLAAGADEAGDAGRTVGNAFDAGQYARQNGITIRNSKL